MGGSYSLYGRKKNNDAYILMEDNLEKPFDTFKHHVISYTMDKKNTNLKSIYLYRGYLREAKAIDREEWLSRDNVSVQQGG